MTNPLINALPETLSRDTLYRALDDYLGALVARDPGRVRWSATVRFTENNVALMVGDGTWNTASGLGNYDLRFADPQNRQMGMFGLIDNMGQSRVGLQGVEPLGGDWSGVFKIETFFNPQSGQISDAQKSMVQNNGRSAAKQTVNLNSSVACNRFRPRSRGSARKRSAP